MLRKATIRAAIDRWLVARGQLFNCGAGHRGKITKLYDRTSDQITLNEIERIVICTMLDGNCYIQLDCSPFNTMKSGGN